MITNFENITQELTPNEQQLIPFAITEFQKYTKKNPIKEPEFVSYIRLRFPNLSFNGVRLRKVVNYIRCTALAPLIATSKGYYISYDEKEILMQIKSLRERANSINRCADGLERLINVKEINSNIEAI